MMLAGAVTMIPVCLIWDRLGAVNSLLPLWAGNLFASAFHLFLLRQITLPMLIIFFLGQRCFIEGIASTGIKG